MQKCYASVSITRGAGSEYSILIDGIEFGYKIKPGAKVKYVHDQYGEGAEVTVTFMVDDLIIRDVVLSEGDSGVTVGPVTNHFPDGTVEVVQ